MNIHGQYKQYTDEELMKFIQRNDHAAFNEIYDRYGKRILSFMYKMLDADKHKAQDFLQDLFLKIAENPHLFDPGKKFYTWVFAVAANMCRTAYRNKKVQNAYSIENRFDKTSHYDNNF
ncbi:MAG TPA: RNA polymerase sigma factor, partial [Flavobacteriales bacterium]|nr:RNA polymerase sigma factor [Flavobacteriales bacterium]